ncbi:MAG: Holliday junction branch migration protein RuvA [Pseudobdellovibrio sp.]
MIGYLEGTVFDVTPEHLILKVGGVGYEISATTRTLTDVQVLIGQNLALWIYSHVREDAFTLFGFLTKPEKEFYMQLLKVNGVGPKMALIMMSGAPVEQIQTWIEAGDAKALSALPKIGKKTAEQIVLTLQGKLVILETKNKAKAKPETHRQIASALVNLGFKPALVEQFIDSVPAATTIEDGVRLGLQKLSGQM